MQTRPSELAQIAVAFAPYIAVIISAVVGYLSYRETKRKTKHDELADLYDRLKDDNDQLRSEVEKLRSENESLRRMTTLGPIKQKEEK